MADRDRQVERARQILQEKEAEPRAKAEEEEELAASERAEDRPDPSTKSSGHRKKTTD